MSRKRTLEHTPSGGDSYHVVTAGNILDTTSWPTVALVLAQGRAVKCQASCLEVERRSIVGPSVTLYRIERDEHGIIRTTTVSKED